MRRLLLTCPLLATLVACGAPPSAEDLAESRAALSPSPNDQAAFEYFVNKGLTPFQAAGIVGNLDQESQVDPTAVEPGGPGRGIAQWSVGGRWDTDANDNVLAYATAQGASSSSLDLQLAFIWYELTTFPSYGLAKLQASINVTDATIAFETDFEGCGTCDESTRIADAELALSTYGSYDAGKSGGDAGMSPPHDGGADAGKSSSDAGKSHDGGGATSGGEGGAGAGSLDAATPGATDEGGAPASGVASSEAGATSGGCAMAPASRASGGVGWLGALGAIGFVARRRRRRVTPSA